ncbi:MAG: hypothetical protein AAGF60_07000 [Pseudomonadota bacterium]
MDLVTVIQLLLKRNKIDSQLKQLKQLHDFALKFQRLGQGKVKIEDLKMFSDKNVAKARKSTAEIAKMLAKNKGRPPKLPASNSEKLYQAMMNTAKKHGIKSSQFAKAQQTYKAELKRRQKDLDKIQTALTKEQVRVRAIAVKYRRAGAYALRMAPIIQSFVPWGEQLKLGTTLFKAGQNMSALGSELNDVAAQFEALQKRAQRFTAQVIMAGINNLKWIHKDFKTEAELYLNMLRETPR